ncbi:MAG: Ig-like domain-containing protein, partial [Bacteroidota bacterium]
APFGGPSPVDEGTSAPIIINVANQPGNTAPVAVDDSPSPIREDIGLTGFSYDVFLANDTDADGDELEIVSFDFSNFPGTIEDLRSDREILFRTAVNFSGTIEIPYTVADGQNTSSAIITLTITDIIDELTIGDDGPFSTDVDQSLEIAIADLLANDEANNFGSPITIELTAVGNSTNGVAAIVGDNVVFTPSPGFVGTASFTYDVDVLSGSVFGSDKRVDEGTSNPIIINVEGDIVTPPSVNGSFVLVSKADESLSLQVNSTGNRTSAVVEACDETGQVWTISDRGNGFHKFINDYADRALEAWSPTPGNGDDVTIYTSNNRDWQQWEITDAGDGYFQIGGRYNTRLMTLSNGNAIMLDADGSDNQLWKFLSPEDFACSVNNPPVAEFDGDFFSDPFYTLVEGETLVIPFDSLLANDFDPDGDPLTITEVFFVRNGTPVIVGNTVEFTGESASPGALFGYTVSDGRGGTDRGDVGLNILERPTIEAVDDTPGPVREDIGLTGFSYDVFLANDIGDNLEIESFDFSNFPGTIEDLRAEREILFRTAVNFNGTIEIPYTVTDGQ